VKRAVVFLAGLVLLVSGAVGLFTVTSPPVPAAAASTCAPPVGLLDGGFEIPDFGAGGYYMVNPITGSSHLGGTYPPIPGWRTNDSLGEIEIWHQPGPLGVPVPADEGTQYAELNANSPSTLYQELPTTPGQVLSWQLSHRGRVGIDTMSLHIGPAGGAGPVVATMSDGPAAWGHYTGTYVVPPGQTSTRFAFTADSSDSGSGSLSEGNLLDNIAFRAPPCLTIDKAVSPPGGASVGDVLSYQLTLTNQGGDVATGVTLQDSAPAGTTFVPGSLKVDGATVAGDPSSLGLGTIAPGASVTVDLDVVVSDPAGGFTVDNTATATYGTNLPITPSSFTATSNTASTDVATTTTTSTTSTTTTSTSTTSTTTTSTSTTTTSSTTSVVPPTTTTTVAGPFRLAPDPVAFPPTASGADPTTTTTAPAAPAALAVTGGSSSSSTAVAFAAIGLGLMFLAVRGRGIGRNA
jgi:uncharacterized repeat protein (TIGR01451 family)